MGKKENWGELAFGLKTKDKRIVELPVIYNFTEENFIEVTWDRRIQKLWAQKVKKLENCEGSQNNKLINENNQERVGKTPKVRGDLHAQYHGDEKKRPKVNTRTQVCYLRFHVQRSDS